MTHAEVRLKGLNHPVTIYRDPEGIPHIKAVTIHDAFFAQGYVHAQDRLWHIESDRYKAQGRWAELVGQSGVASDILMRRSLVYSSSRSDYDHVKPETRAMLDAYAAGVNAYIEAIDELPLEYRLLGIRPEPWQPWDGLAVYKVRHIVMGVWEGKLWRARLIHHVGPENLPRLYPGTRYGDLLILPPGATYEGGLESIIQELTDAVSSVEFLKEEGSGSNNWVVGGAKTASGKPLLAGDPHRAVEVPSVYYQNHLACEAFDVIGLSFPGLPGFPHFGHNEHVAWCITHVGADNQDLFIERFDPANPGRYLFKGEWLEAEVRQESIRVRGGAPIPLEVVVTHHGGVIGGDPAKGLGLALRYTATLGENSGWDCLLPMLTARSCDEFDAMMRDWVDPVNNLLYADRQGNFGYRTRGKVPVRSRLHGWLPAPGWTGEHEWLGMVAYDELPRQMNPEDGYIVTANNRVTGDEYPYYIGLTFAADHRARRIAEQLEGEGLTAAEMAAIHADRTSRPALMFLGRLTGLDPSLGLARQARDMLLAWDGQMAADRPEPLIYAVTREELLDLVLRPILPPDLFHEAFRTVKRGGSSMVSYLRPRIMQMAAFDDRSLLPEGSTWGPLLLEALERAVSRLRKEFGPDMSAWRWGDLHQLKVVHPLAPLFPEQADLLNPAPLEMDGDADTPQASGYVTATGFTVYLTSVARYLFDLANWEQSAWVVPLGVSGHPGSAHYLDQRQAFAEHRLVPMRFDWGRIEAEQESKQVLSPQ